MMYKNHLADKGLYELCQKKPKAFLLENVKNLKNHDRGKTFEAIENTLTSLGYAVTTALFKAKECGVPQNRERIYLIGFKKDLENRAQASRQWLRILTF